MKVIGETSGLWSTDQFNQIIILNMSQSMAGFAHQKCIEREITTQLQVSRQTCRLPCA